MNGFSLSLAEVGAIFLVASTLGYLATPAFLPGESGSRAYRPAWGLLIGASLVAGIVPLSFLIGARPGWVPLLVLGGFVILCTRWFATIPPRESTEAVGLESFPGAFIPLLLILVGVATYTLTSLAEPMWATDYLAIWGLKAKTIYGAGELPDRLFSAFTLRFSLPEYPLGLSMFYAGTAFLLGRWDDHALALVFPLLQIVTLMALYGWLRRRRASRALALAVIAPLSLFYPLYADRVGTAEVPLSFGILLFGISLADGVDATDAGALRRLAIGSFFVTTIKNEGWFVVLAAVMVLAVYSLVKRSRPRLSLLAAALLPAAAVRLLHLLRRGPLPLQAFDFGYLSPSRSSELASRLWRTAAVALDESLLPAWPALLALLLLGACGRKRPSANVLLGVLALCVASYVFLPALTPDPVWQIRNSFERTVAPLAPLLAAALALRLIPLRETEDPPTS